MRYRFDSLRFTSAPGTTSRQNKKVWVAAGGLAALVLFMITVSVIGQRDAARAILVQGVTVPGVVVPLSDVAYPQNVPSGERRPTLVGVRFTDRSGKVQQQITWQFIGWGEQRRLQPGVPVEIVYLPAQTSNTYVKSSLERVAASTWVAVLTGLSTAAGLAALSWGLHLKAVPDPTDQTSDTLPSPLD